MKNTVYTLGSFGGGTLSAGFFRENIVRLRFAADGADDGASFIVVGETESLAADIEEKDGRMIVSRPSLSAEYKDEAVTFSAPGRGELLTAARFGLDRYDVTRQTGGDISVRETVDGVRTTVDGGKAEIVRSSHHGHVTFVFDDDETIYGLGSHEEGFDSLRGRFVPLYQENMRIAVPVFVSTKGYGVLIDCASVMTFDFTDSRRGKLTLDSVDAVDLYFIFGGDFDGVCRGLRCLTGAAPMLPKWSLGYIQSKERYASQEEIVGIGKKYRELGVPIDAVVQDWLYWKDGLWGNKHFDPERFPDPKAMTDELHGMDLRLMISVWPNLSGDSEDRLEMLEKGYLLGDGSTVDVFRDEARALYWKQAYEGLFRYGIDGWWCDSSEPFDAVWGGQERPPLPERMKKSVGEFKKYLDDGVLNVYSLMHSKGMYENQRKVSDKRVINLTRSGYPGQHRYGTVVWSGDLSSNWETLRRQVRVVQNYVSTGEPWWNSDIGAFFSNGGYEWFRDGDYPGGYEDQGYRELYVRWLQFAAFTPMMRSHGTNTPREVWRFGERGTPYRDAIEKAIRLRYELIPYLYSVHAAVTFDGVMPLRPLALEFPDDREAAKASGEYMYGHELIVAPVTEPGAESVFVYLPEGVWYDYETGERYDGGRYISTDAGIGRIPLFVRGGSIIPVAPPVQSTKELLNIPLRLRVYPGADGRFTLYDDEGDGYGYESGDYTAVTYTWDDAEKKLGISSAGNDRWAHPAETVIIGGER